MGECRYRELHVYTFLELEKGKLSATCPYHFTHRKLAHGILWIGHWIDASLSECTEESELMQSAAVILTNFNHNLEFFNTRVSQLRKILTKTLSFNSEQSCYFVKKYGTMSEYLVHFIKWVLYNFNLCPAWSLTPQKFWPFPAPTNTYWHNVLEIALTIYPISKISSIFKFKFKTQLMDIFQRCDDSQDLKQLPQQMVLKLAAWMGPYIQLILIFFISTKWLV